MEHILDVKFWWEVLSEPSHLAIIIALVLAMVIYHVKFLNPKFKEIMDTFKKIPTPIEKLITEDSHIIICNGRLGKFEEKQNGKIEEATGCIWDDLHRRPTPEEGIMTELRHEKEHKLKMMELEAHYDEKFGKVIEAIASDLKTISSNVIHLMEEAKFIKEIRDRKDR